MNNYSHVLQSNHYVLKGYNYAKERRHNSATTMVLQYTYSVILYKITQFSSLYRLEDKHRLKDNQKEVNMIFRWKGNT